MDIFKWLIMTTLQKFFPICELLLCWGLTTRQPLRVILCCLPEKGRKEIRRESRGDEREGQ